MRGIQTEHLAMLAIALSGAAWGLFWIPLRALEAAGVAGLWTVVLFYLVPALMLAPMMLWRWRKLVAGGWPLHLAGLLAGTSLALYAGALVFTDVVRALIFFYLTPIWSTILARVMLGERITALRAATIMLASLGLLFIVRLEGGLAASLNIGDVMGLVSGLLWAFAAVSIRGGKASGGVDFTLAYFLWGSVAALVLALVALPLGGASPPPSPGAIGTVLIWLVPVVLVLVIPPGFAIMWGATILSPGLVAILFMTEISAGAITAAIWGGEPLGWREIVGVVLITLAGALEPVVQLRRAAPD